MTSTANNNTASVEPDREARFRRIVGWIAFGFAMLLVVTLVAAVVQPRAPDRFRGAEGVSMALDRSEPMWWIDLVVSKPSTTVAVSAAPPTVAPDDPELPDTTSVAATEAAPTVDLVAPGDALFPPDDHQIGPDTLQRFQDTIRDVVGDGTVTSGVVRCFTDDRGSNNDELSDRRADAILSALDGLGLNTTPIDAQGMGVSTAYDNTTETGRARNRRCEIRLTVRS